MYLDKLYEKQRVRFYKRNKIVNYFKYGNELLIKLCLDINNDLECYL